ncbi:hypothetical protein BVC80_9091g155 [Macleaya cordata]|uniref:Transmembrane protein n=1 Tax=Macleaya cordata TaxID=56857 RepID=A0A200PWR8_MACCD|nr:hypothetical protein BVC80_9091g155 [Macleaya cordata]
MIEDQAGGRGAPHGLLFAVVVGLVVMVPILLGDQGEALTEAITELLSPFGLLMVPVVLLLVIQFLSSDRASALSSIFSASTGEPDSIHRLSGSPVGVALVLLIVLFLLYNRFSLFGSEEDDSE